MEVGNLAYDALMRCDDVTEATIVVTIAALIVASGTSSNETETR